MTGPARGVPWYVHPAEAPSAWADLPRVLDPEDFVVVNPHNGPGAADDPYYPAAIGALAGPGVVGYVDIAYGARPVREVRQDVEQWVGRYGVRAVMLDQVPADGRRQVARYARAARGAGARRLVGNPGTVAEAGVADLFDIVCLAETDAAAYLADPQAPPARLRARVWHLVHSCPDELADVVWWEAERRGADYVHVTRQGLPHPWGGWDESSAVRRRPATLAGMASWGRDL